MQGIYNMCILKLSIHQEKNTTEHQSSISSSSFRTIVFLSHVANRYIVFHAAADFSYILRLYLHMFQVNGRQTDGDLRIQIKRASQNYSWFYIRDSYNELYLKLKILTRFVKVDKLLAKSRLSNEKSQA